MANTEIILTIISVMGTICGIVFGYVAFSRNRKHDIESETQDLAEIKIDIKYIKDGVAELKLGNKEMSKTQSALEKRIVVLESKVDNYLEKEN